MTKIEKRLTVKGIEALGDGLHADGGGLYISVSGTSRSWIWRYRRGDRRRDMGLGAFPSVSLAKGRAERDKWREVLKTGADPIDERERQATATRSAVSTVPTFGQAADDFIAAKEPGWRNVKHVAQWRMTLRDHAAAIRKIPVDKVSATDVLGVLKPIWQKTPETASRLRGRIEMVIDFARAHGHIDEGRANPARWRGHLDKMLPKQSALSRGHHSAMPYKDVPAFVRRLRALDAVSARGLEFTILTATRTGESMKARWEEIDLAGRLWTIPATRMKAGKEHRVPLSDRAVELLLGMQQLRLHAFVFPGNVAGKPLSNMAFDMLLRREKQDFTAHGFRSSFRDWAGDCTSFTREVAEAALAHVVGSKVEAAYRRGDALEKRRELMAAWATYLAGEPGANVVNFDKRRADPA